MTLVGLALLGLVLAGCTSSSSATTVSVAVPTTAPTLDLPAPSKVTPQVPEYELESCGGAVPFDFVLLCETHERLSGSYVDPIDDGALVAAALLGLDQVSAGVETEIADRTLDCVVPNPTFEPLCQGLVDRLRTDPAPIEALVEGAVQGIFRYGLDPFSAYVPPDYADRLGLEGPGYVYALGMVVAARNDSGAPCTPIMGGCRLQVITVFEFGSADQAGLVEGDLMLAVDGVALTGLSGLEAIARLYGNPGTSVRVTVERPGGPLEKSLVQEDIRFEPIEYELAAGNVAYLRLNEFSQLSAQLLGQVLQTEEVAGAGAIILDLRDNPGGLVLAAQAVASQFLDGGSVMVEMGNGWRYEFPVIEGGLANGDQELVVLVNGGSASASEIVAAVLQERGRAVVIGEPTFGKNLVQEVGLARNGGELRITVARWTTPLGLDVGLVGLQPDLIVETPPDTEGDPVLDRALALVS